jgi:hypothetical protein
VVSVHIVVKMERLPAQNLLPAQATGHSSPPYTLLPELAEFAVSGPVAALCRSQAPSHDHQLERVPTAPLKASSTGTA